MLFKYWSRHHSLLLKNYRKTKNKNNLRKLRFKIRLRVGKVLALPQRSS